MTMDSHLHPKLIEQIRLTQLENAEILKDQRFQALLRMVSTAYMGDETIAEPGQEWLQAVINAIPDYVYVKDVDLRFVFCNVAKAQSMGTIQAQEIYGKTDDDFYPPDIVLQNRKDDLQVLVTGIPLLNQEEITTDHNGLHIWVSSNKIPLRDQEGKIYGIVCISHDISARKNLNRKLEENQRQAVQQAHGMQRRAQELLILSEVRTLISQELDVKQLMQNIVQIVASHLGYDFVSLYLVEGNYLRLQFQQGYQPETIIESIPLGTGIMARVIRTGSPILLADVTLDSEFLRADESIISEVSVPILDHERATGVLNIESITTLDNNDLRLLNAISDQVGFALERARLYTSLKLSRQQYEQVVENVREVIFQADINACWTFLNAAWPRLTGYSTDESLGRQIQMFIHPGDRERFLMDFKHLTISDIDNFHQRLRLIRKDGTEHWFEAHLQIVRSDEGNLPEVAGTLRDIAEKILAEEQAIELQLQQRTVEALRGLLSSMSHDLRTPLSVMKTSAYLLRRKFAGTDSRQLDIIDDRLNHLSRILEDMAEIFRLDENVIEFQFIRADLNGLIRDVLMSSEASAQLKNQTITFLTQTEQIRLWFDQVMLGKAIRHLLDNAIHFTPEKGSINIKTTVTSDTAILEIQDTGVGISPEHLPYIWQRFYKADTARSGEEGGTGLGLAIVQKIIEAHQGHISVESQLEIGTAFRITLPLKVTSRL